LFFQRRDRREWALLGAVVLAYGLGLSPLVHAIVQHGAEGAPDSWDAAWVHHRSGPAPATPHSHSHSHSPGSVEHLNAVAPVPPALPQPVRPVTRLTWVVEGRARARAARMIRPSAMPQGP
jgi:hypothetical protein